MNNEKKKDAAIKIFNKLSSREEEAPKTPNRKDLEDAFNAIRSVERDKLKENVPAQPPLPTNPYIIPAPSNINPAYAPTTSGIQGMQPGNYKSKTDTFGELYD